MMESKMTAPKGKIAFIYPAKFNMQGASSPTLNFVDNNHSVAMSVGISFLELDPSVNYFVTFSLYDSNGNEVVTSSGMGAIPSDQIDPERKTSFLSASFHFGTSSYGTYKFSCQLIDLMYDNGKAIDSSDVYFNVIRGEA